jgi:perosamine synthetase
MGRTVRNGSAFVGRPVKKIHYTMPSITDLEISYAKDAAENGWGSQCYDYIYKFEDAFKAHLGCDYALATSSCTGAMHLGLAALGIGPGDEVIVPDINWIASLAPITYLGATPIFVDVCSDTWCIDPSSVEKAITRRTKAIIAVHLYGNVAAIATLQKCADRYGITLIEDAAEALGSKIDCRAAGTMAKFGVFSFHGTKTITTGEGGMFVTNDPELYEKVYTLNNHGRERGEAKQFWSSVVGYKYKLSNIQAAIGFAQVERIKDLVARKREIFQLYRQQLIDESITMNPEYEGMTNGYWMPTVVVDDHVRFDRKLMFDVFRQHDIDARVFFWPVSSLPMFENVVSNTVSYSIYNRGFNLPSYHDMLDSDIELISDVVKKGLRAQ